MIKLHSAEPEKFVIPSNYRGKIRIIYNQKCGKKIQYENGRRLYLIPDDGILFTQFKDEQGFINQKFYLMSNEKELEIKQLNVQDFNEEWTLEKNENEPSRDQLAIFNSGTGYSNGDSEFYICTYKQFKTFDWKYDSKFDSLVIVKKNQLNLECK